MATREHIAPIEYYARMVWLLGFVILLFFVLIMEHEDRTVRFLFYLAVPFLFAWWVKVPELEPTPVGRLLPQVGIGFLFGLGGLWVLLLLVPVLLSGLARLWWIPPTLALNPTQAIWLQLGVGIVEEGIFRVALPRLMATRQSWGASILLSNWIFGLFHWQAYQGNLTAVIVAVGVGLLQSIAYFMSRNPLGVMLGHAIWNLAVAGLLSGFFLYLAWALFILGLGYYLKLRVRRRR